MNAQRNETSNPNSGGSVETGEDQTAPKPRPDDKPAGPPAGTSESAPRSRKGFGRAIFLLLAAALAVLPWATVLVLTPGVGGFRARAAIALIASLLLLSSLLGRRMFDRYEGSARHMHWSGRRMSLVRWSIVFNLASLLNLYLFVAAYRYRVEWHIVIPALVLGGLILSLLLLAHQKTVGILAVALSGLLFLPAGAYFVGKEATYSGEAALFALLFLPGILAAGATLLAYGGPMYQYFRDAA